MANRFFGERQNQYKDRYGFRWRGSEVTRIEGFSDAVFAFSVTLLIVSLEVPHTFTELLATMKGFLAFAASFAILIWIWHVHYTFFRRYGLQDAFTKTVNAILLFVVLFYVYPLKFVFTSVIQFWSGGGFTTTLADGSVVPIVTPGDLSMMMIIYGIGFIAVFLCYVALHMNARRKKEELRLNQVEVFITSMQAQQYSLCIVIGLASISIALWGGDEMSKWSGLTYSLLGPVLGFHGFLSSRRIKKIEAQMQQQYPQRGSQQQRQGEPRQQYQRQQRPQGERRPQGQQRPQSQQGQPRHQGPRPQGQQRHPDQRRHDQRQQPPPPPQQGGEPDQSQQPRREQNPE
ncbi:MAG: TMEM175 family protein [Bacteroidota bacterium]